MALTDEASGLQAFIAIHNTNLGLALGGTRMQAYDTEDDAVIDALNLSRAMSYKCALANLPYGGGKAVVMESKQLDRDQVLAAYARLVEKLGGLLKTGTDVGISDEDVAKMAKYTSHMLGVKAADRGDLNTSNVAALGVFYAIQAALARLYGTEELTGRKVAIKGAGKLGGELARLVTEAGGQVYISDIVEERCQTLQTRLSNVTAVPNGQIHKQVVDVYAPCALGGEFNEDTIKELRCKAIAGGANNQLADDAAGDLLYKRDILYVPDYIANAGGLIYVADELEADGFNQKRVLERTKSIKQTIATILERAEQEKVSPHRMADLVAIKRIKEARHD